MGTPAFMAPEQALAHWEDVDGRTDLWAVGATMFMLLSGRHVHEAQSSQEQLILSATAPARSLATSRRAFRGRSSRIVDRALAFDRAGRWPDASAMQAAVRTVLDALAGQRPRSAVSVRRPSATLPGATRRERAVGGGDAHRHDGPDLRRGGVDAGARGPTSRDGQASRGDRRGAGPLLGAKKTTAEAEKRLEAGRAERTSLEQWFTRQVGTRTAAVEDARKEVRRATSWRSRGRRSQIGPRSARRSTRLASRSRLLDRAAESAARDVVVHEAALEAYEAPAVRIGVVLLGVAAVVALALLVAPIVWRATRVIEPPPPAHSGQH